MTDSTLTDLSSSQQPVSNEKVDDDSHASALHGKPVSSSREDRLGRYAYRIMTRLQGSRRRLLKTLVPNALQGIAVRAGTAEAHLFLIRSDAEGYRTGSLRYSSSPRRFQALERFPFQLMSARLRNCLLADQAAIVKMDSPHLGGPLIEGILQQTGCSAYLLCPLMVKKELRGILGVAAKDAGVLTPPVRRLLKFNGMSLFWAIRNARREARHRRRFREWKQIAHQACDLAFTIDANRTIQRAVAPGGTGELRRLEGRSIKELVEPPFHAGLLTAIDRAVRRNAVRTCNFRMSTGDEESRWYAARIEPTQPAPQTVMLYLTDNHEDQSRQELVRALENQLRRTERLRLLGKMSTEFAHQLKQPMQAMLTYCNTMQKRIRSGVDNRDDSLRLLNSIETAIEHSDTIIQRIREFVREGKLTITTVSLGNLLNMAILLVSPTAQDLKAVLVTPDSDTDVDVEADATQTAHILVNLIVNALEACRDFETPNPRIEIQVDTEDQRWVSVSVIDNGPGLPEDRIEDLFGEFRSEKKGGVGIGLSMSRDICRAQRGDLVASNNSNGPGCTFRFTLPRSDSDDGDTVEIDQLPPDIRLLD